MPTSLTIESPDISQEAVSASIQELFSLTPLCSIATASGSGEPNVATAFYVLDETEMVLSVLTGPTTVHGLHIAASGRAALNVFSTDQGWDSDKRGLQINASAGLTAAADVPATLERYLASYPGLRAWINSPADIENIDSRLFSFQIQSLKIFDEPRFGKEVWVSASVQRA